MPGEKVVELVSHIGCLSGLFAIFLQGISNSDRSIQA